MKTFINGDIIAVYMADTLVLYLARHGETDWNNEGRLQGRSGDRGLNETGRIQARRLVEIFKDVPIQRIYTSPLMRARGMADTLQSRLGIDSPVIQYEPLTEVDLGRWEGSKKENWPEPYQTLLHAAIGLKVETNGGIEDRVAESNQFIRRNEKSGHVIVSGHTLFFSAAFNSAVEQDYTNANLLEHGLKNGQFHIVEFSPDGKVIDTYSKMDKIPEKYRKKK